MSDDPLLNKLEEETERTWTQLQRIKQMPNLSDAQKRAIAEMDSPAGSQSAIAEAIANANKEQHRTLKPWMLAVAMVIALLCAILAVVWIHVPQSN